MIKIIHSPQKVNLGDGQAKARRMRCRKPSIKKAPRLIFQTTRDALFIWFLPGRCAPGRGKRRSLDGSDVRGFLTFFALRNVKTYALAFI